MKVEELEHETIIEQIGDCIFCKKPKTWNSDQSMRVNGKEYRVTVCEDCRKKKTIAQMNYEISRKLWEPKEKRVK